MDDNIIKYLASDSQYGGQRRLADLAKTAKPGTYPGQNILNAVADIQRPSARGGSSAAGAARPGIMKCVLNSLLRRK